MAQTLSVTEANLKRFNLSVTVRDNGEDASILEELAYRTIGIWLWIAQNLDQGVYKLPPYEGFSSVETRYAEDINKAADADTDKPKSEPFQFHEVFGDARVTVWDSFRGSKRINFHLNSDDDLQTAVNVWLATQNATKRAFEKWGDKLPEKQQEDATSVSSNIIQDKPATPKNPPQTPNQPAQPVEGAIVATRAPKSSEVQYADGQLVSYTVTKIVASANKGSPVYEMWTPLGTQWPTIKVYKLDTKGKEKPDYKTIVGILATLNLSLDKPEAMGTWRLICKAAHVPGENGDHEFLNVVSLTAI